MRLWPFLIILALTACQVSKKPDLAQLYLQHATDHSNTPLILIHGTMGSKLRDKNSSLEVWPGKINQLIFSNYKNLANEIDPETISIIPSDIESYAIFDSYSGLSIYDEIIKTLTKYGGFQLNEINTQLALPGRNLYIFHYDWRQDNVKNAQLLANYIDTVLSKHPEHTQVDVVAHSMGGLILRYYQRFGTHDVLNQLDHLIDQPTLRYEMSQADKIRHAIFLGTPQLGSVKSVIRLHNGFDFNLRTVPVEVQITMPSIYQLLPHPDAQWATDETGKIIDIDIFDPLIWRSNLWSIYDPKVQQRIINKAETSEAGQQEVKTLQKFFQQQLIRAKAFWLSLSPPFEVEHEGFVIMGGDCNKTLNRLIVVEDKKNLSILKDLTLADGFKTRALHRSILFEPGDGLVSKSSLLGQIHDQKNHLTTETIRIKYPVFVCENHIKLTQNITFQDNLLHVLLH